MNIIRGIRTRFGWKGVGCFGILGSCLAFGMFGMVLQALPGGQATDTPAPAATQQLVADTATARPTETDEPPTATTTAEPPTVTRTTRPTRTPAPPTATLIPTTTRIPSTATRPPPTATLRPAPTQPAIAYRTGATCKDGTSSSATGSGACSRHGGVLCWRYSDGTCR